MNPTGDPIEDNLFKHPYMDLQWFLEDDIVGGLAEVGELKFSLDDFCYKPITGAGCLVESPMQYFKEDYSYLASLSNEEI